MIATTLRREIIKNLKINAQHTQYELHFSIWCGTNQKKKRSDHVCSETNKKSVCFHNNK